MGEGKMLKLWKYRTLGCSFIMVDNRDGSFDELAKDNTFKKYLCNMDFGIGGTGIIEIRSHDKHAFEVLHHTGKSGERGAACGTGSRCAVVFARDRGIIEDGTSFYFQSYEGRRTGNIVGNFVTTTMSDDCKFLKIYDENNYFIDPKCHIHVRFVESGFEEYNIIEEGMKVTGMEEYKSIFPTPILMLVKICKEIGGIDVRSFDRATNEKLELFGCGTGETGSVMAYTKKLGLVGKHLVRVRWRDGETSVTLTRDSHDQFSDILLSGSAMHVFNATVDVEKFKGTYMK